MISSKSFFFTLGCALGLLFQPGEGAGQSTALYSVNFVATWSSATHPTGFPGSAHFSGLIGGSHNASIEFWEPDAIATQGIERMAETGSKTTLQAEIEDSIQDGKAYQVLSGGGIGRSPGSVSISFAASSDFPLLTLVSMLAPSPDWFVGVHSLPLFENGKWIDSLEVPLIVYDAGTDSGSNYTSPNADTNPAVPIALLTSPPFAQSGLVGRFVLTRTRATSHSIEQPQTLTVSQPYPNPAKAYFRIQLHVKSHESAIIRVFDVMGRMVVQETTAIPGNSPFTFQIRVADLPPGLYFVQAEAGGSVRRMPVTVQR
jgi:hypothetical protein